MKKSGMEQYGKLPGAKITEAIHALGLTEWEARQMFYFTLGVMVAKGNLTQQLTTIHEEATLIVKTRLKKI